MVGRLSRRLGWRQATIVVLGALFVVGPAVRLLNTLALAPWAVVLAERVTYALPGEISFFVAGMTVALWSVQAEVDGRLPRLVRGLTERPALAWGLAAACLVLVATFGGYQAPVAVPGIGVLDVRTQFIADQLLICLCVALVMLPAAFTSGPRRLPHRVLRWRAFSYVGLVSYGLYLWHAPLAAWMVEHASLRTVYLSGWPTLASWLVGCAVILAVGLVPATLSYYLVELPFLRLKRGWRHGPEAVPTAVEPARSAAP